MTVELSVDEDEVPPGRSLTAPGLVPADPGAGLERRTPYDAGAGRRAEVATVRGPACAPGRTTRRLRPGAARRGRPAQRRRPLPLLAPRGDRRRPRHPPARLPRRDRELAARLQHRHGRPHRQRVPRRRGAHRRQPPVEPPRRDGHRPLPARAPPRRPSTDLVAWAPGRGAAAARHRQPARARCRSRRYDAAAARACLLFGQEGPGLSEPARAACDGRLSIAQFGSTRSINAGAAAAIAMHAWVRQHAFDQRPTPGP